MKMAGVFVLLLCVALSACSPKPSAVVTPAASTKAASVMMIQQIIVKPITLNSVDAQGNLLPSFISELENFAHVEMAYIRPMFGGAHVLTFVQPIDSSQAGAIFTVWRSKGLIEYAEPDGVAHPSNPLN